MTHFPRHLLKSLLVWLMLVAIPFQGFAAAGMLAGAPQQARVAMTPEHCAMMAGAHQHAASADHGHAAHGAATHHDAGGKCSTCASCCFGAVMAPPAPIVRMPARPAALALFHFTDNPVARVDLALPERPPKPSLT